MRYYGLHVFLCIALLGASRHAPAQARKARMAPASATADHSATAKRRVLILTDIGDDPDDRMSLIRFLTYSNQWDVAGVIVGTSIHKKDFLSPYLVEEVLAAYEKVQPNLLLHQRGYPTANALRSRVKLGLPVYGMAGVGQGKDSEGSRWIVQQLAAQDERPLWVPVWGGANTLAQALWTIQHTYSPQDATKLYAKLRVYTISDQDDSGAWIRRTFPEVFYVASPGGNYLASTWIGMAFKAPGSNTEVVSREWLAKNIQQGHGPLGAVYPDVAYGMEGDSPSFLGLIDNGLNDPEHPNLGGWGGRYAFYKPEFTPLPATPAPGITAVGTPPETRPLWTNTDDTVVSSVDGKAYTTNQATLWRWREEYQNDFAARICWTAKPYAQCNHAPVAVLRSPVTLTVHSGEEFHLDATGSYDPDGDSLSYLWFLYPEEGSYRSPFPFDHVPNLRDLLLTAPAVNAPSMVHFILRVTDKGSPPLTSYRRVTVNLLPPRSSSIQD